MNGKASIASFSAAKMRALSLILGISGILYGITGVVQLSITIDRVLLLGLVVMLIVFGRKEA